MNKAYTQLRIWRSTLQMLRRIYAETGESMIATVDRLAIQEFERISHDHQDIQVQTLPGQEK